MTDILLETVPCNLCGSLRSRVRYATSDPWDGGGAGHFAATTDKFGAYGIVRECLDCGLLYTSPRPVAGALLSGYEGNEDADYDSERDSRSVNAHFSLAMIRRYAPGGRLLEVGCANGFFLNAARMSYETLGVEPSRAARDYARGKLRLDVPAATMEEARFPDASMDVVAMIDVIEHLADPLSILREAARVIKPGGVLYLVTPDVESLSARILRSRWWGLRPAHIYYFSPRTLAAMLEKAGFRVVESRSYGRIFSWGYWLTRLSNYPRAVTVPVEILVRLLGIRDKFLYLDTRDSMQVVARKI
ncbi:MAG: class I SAM-dependent methyltransferase [Elusimicrobiota bacterium]|jgi:SAM-dependent methyltransferase